MARSSMAALIARLRLLVGDPSGSAAVYSAWQATHAYVLGDYRRPTVANGRFYRALVAGTSGASQPTFPTDGTSVIDGTTVWADQGLIPSGSQTFSDDELQGFLDERRLDVIQAALRALPVAASGSLTFSDFFAPRRFWENSVVLLGPTGATLTPDSADLTVGRWTFTAGQAIPVFISGSCFDLYGTAQAVCEAWAGAVSREFDFSTDQQDFSRSQKLAGLLMVAREYARKAQPPGMRPGWRSANW